MFALGFFLPLLAGGNTLFLLPAEDAFHLFLVLAVLVAVILAARRSPARPFPLVAAAALALLLLWCSLLFFVRPAGARAGIELQALAMAAVLHLLLLRRPLAPDARLAFLLGLFVGVAGTAINAQHQYWVVFPRIAPVIRAAGYPFFDAVNANFYSANCYAPFLAATTILAIAVVRSRPPIRLAVVAGGVLPIVLVTLFLTRSRSTIALLAAGLLLAWLARRDRPRLFLPLAAGLLVLASTAIYVVDFDELWRVAIRGRIAIWHGAGAMIADHWLLGVGLGRFAEEFPRYQITEYYTRYPHNLLLEILAETGIVGAASLLAFLGASLTAAFGAAARSGYDPLPAAAALAAAILIAHAMVDIDWRAPANPLLLFLLLALARGEPAEATR